MQSVEQKWVHLISLPIGRLCRECNHALLPVRLLKAADHVGIISRPRTLPIALNLVFTEARRAYLECLLVIPAAIADSEPHFTDTGSERVVGGRSRLVLTKSAVLLETCFDSRSHFEALGCGLGLWTGTLVDEFA